MLAKLGDQEMATMPRIDISLAAQASMRRRDDAMRDSHASTYVEHRWDRAGS